MKRKKTLLILIVLNLLVFCLVFTNTGRASKYYKQIIFSSKDSHVFNEFPDNNYGDSEYMQCGNYITEHSFALRKNIAFIYFNISSIESGWEMVSLSLTVHNIPKPLDLDMGFVNEYWSEETITWINGPSNITWAVKSLNFTADGTCLFDITDLIFPSTLELNIILYDHDIEDDVKVLINSKEYLNQNYHPHLVFHYPSYSIRPNLSYYFRLIILIVSCFIGFTYIIMKILKRKKAKKNSDYLPS